MINVTGAFLGNCEISKIPVCSSNRLGTGAAETQRRLVRLVPGDHRLWLRCLVLMSRGGDTDLGGQP